MANTTTMTGTPAADAATPSTEAAAPATEAAAPETDVAPAKKPDRRGGRKAATVVAPAKKPGRRGGRKAATAEAPAKKPGRGGRKPGKWIHLKKDAVAQYRKDAKLSRTKLAELLDVSPTSIQNWETGHSVPVKRFQERLVELMSGKPASMVDSQPASKGASRGKPSAGRPSRPVAKAPEDSSSVQAQVTRLSVAGEILKGYLATPQGGRVSADQLVALVTSLRDALT